MRATGTFLKTFLEKKSSFYFTLLAALFISLMVSCTTTDSEQKAEDGTEVTTEEVQSSEETTDKTVQDEGASPEEAKTEVAPAPDVAAVAPATTSIPQPAPAPINSAAKELPKSSAQQSFTYKVKRGDWLSKIAKRVYNDMHKWDLIYKANPSLRNPNRILIGQKIEIPVIDDASGAFAKNYKMAKASNHQSSQIKTASVLKVKSTPEDKSSVVAKKAFLQRIAAKKAIDQRINALGSSSKKMPKLGSKELAGATTLANKSGINVASVTKKEASLEKGSPQPFNLKKSLLHKPQTWHLDDGEKKIRPD